MIEFLYSKPFSLMIDVIIAILLAVTIFYAYRLSKVINVIRDSRADLSVLIRDLNSGIIRAEQAIHGLREIAIGSGDELQDRINKSRELVDELLLINEAGENLANRLSNITASGKSKDKSHKFQGETDTEEEFFADDELKKLIKSETMQSKKVTVSEKDSKNDTEFESSAEAELYKAIKSKNHNKNKK